MTQDSTEPSNLTDAAKAALLDSGVIPKLKNTLFADTALKDSDTQALKAKGHAMAEDLQQLISGGQLEDADLQKLMDILTRLQGALQGGGISREALVMALSEATAAVGSTNGVSKSLSQQKTDKLWAEIELHNKAIDDDFKKMREIGILFDEKLWEKHNQLSEHMLAHPQDIEKQKELNAVDDQLLQQVEGQLAKHPQAKPAFEHAKQESEERHQVVDDKLGKIKAKKATLDTNTELDWGSPDLTMNDIQAPTVGKKTNAKGNTIS